MRIYYLSHPEVAIDPATAPPLWTLSDLGRARVRALSARGWPGGAVAVVSSPEVKAVETAALLGLPFVCDPGMGEVDRSATGYVPPERHEALADALFARPAVSAEGWERALDAQARVLAAFHRALEAAGDADLLLVGHGGVGTLLWCALTASPIRRSADQPGQGHVWALAAGTAPMRPLWPWTRFEALP
jgi:broad specificity phosphatase PhoE